jgi:hypothetical protein
MRRRIAATLLTAAVAVAVGLPSAHAAALAGNTAQVHTAVLAPADNPPPGYTYEGTFYWHASCEEAGNGGIPRAWSAYICLGDGWPWDSYDLYVKYN